MPGSHPPPDTFDQDHAHHTGLEAKVAAIVAPVLEGMGYELVRVAIMGGKARPTVQIMSDRADGAMIGIADCETISHAVSAVLDVNDPIPGAWVLEVSSAGIDRPLTRARDWNRFSGHRAKVEMAVPVDGRRRMTGIAIGADEAAARLRLDDGPELTLPLGDIRRAKLVLTDALIEATAHPSPDQSIRTN